MREVNYDERWKVARDLACKINLWPTVENLRHLDAALRRAKAEGLDDAAKAICMYCNDPEWQKRDEDDNHESPYTRTMYPCAAYKIHDLIRELDARAAQIEEGE